MTLDEISPQIVEQGAREVPEMKNVTLKMTNLHLHSSGVFSNVYRGTLLEPAPRREIAIKKTWPEVLEKNFELIFLTGISRERHKNIVQMLYVFSNRNPKDQRVCEAYIFDFMPSTLAQLIKEETIDPIDLRVYTWQLFNGLLYLSQNLIAHRDIKPVNLLVNSQTGLLKIGDFGSAKIIKKDMQSTAYQVTRFYRPPELLMGATRYNHTVDLWSSGCVLGEMLRGAVLFPGRDTKHQIKLVFTALGSPSQDDLVAMKVNCRLEGSRVRPAGIQALMLDALPEHIDIVNRILVYNPKQRLGGRDFLLDPWFDCLWVSGARRKNGQLVADVIKQSDIYEVPAPKKRERKKASTTMRQPGSKDEQITSEEAPTVEGATLPNPASKGQPSKEKMRVLRRKKSSNTTSDQESKVKSIIGTINEKNKKAEPKGRTKDTSRLNRKKSQDSTVETELATVGKGCRVKASVPHRKQPNTEETR